jgi:curved DNA-binding protein CbpA
MQPASAGRDENEAVPRLAPGWERCGLSLSPAEGFLLSRIDGATPWNLLREIGGLAPAEADRCLARWVARGLVELVTAAGSSAAPNRVAALEIPAGIKQEAAPAAVDPEAEVDPSLEIPVEAQRRVLRFEAGLDRPYHELLSVEPGVDGKAIKRAYFQLSKEFHPDRYYRRQIGPYAEKLDRIFKRVVEAYELMMDPTTRAELERSIAGRAPEPAAPEPPAPEAGARPAAPPPSAGRRALERLHRQLRIPDAILAERRARAREFHGASLVALRKQSWLEAAASARLAIAFDPWNAEYKRGFGEVQARVNEMRANELLERANASADAHASQEALRLFEEALHYRPHDPTVNARAAELALEMGDFARAQEYAERACEARPDVAAYQGLVGRVLARQGVREKALAAFERAVALDPKDKKLAEDLKKLRRAARRPIGGKR